MKWWITGIASLAVGAGLAEGVVWARPTPPGSDIGAEARNIFSAKCARCHGPDLEKPRGRFGYVLDLPRMAGNPELVVPGRPEESELWALIGHDEMPPPGSPHGPLTTPQKEVIRGWIAAGAPDASPVAPSDRFLRWLGKFHLLLLHFPIALVMAAGFGEIRSTWRREPRPSESVRFCSWLAALAAIPTVGLGWLHASSGYGLGANQLLAAHRWLGTASAAWLLATAALVERDARKGARGRATWPLLASEILFVALTAHLGGLLDRGGDFFDY